MNGFMLIRHRVADFATWTAAYDAHAPQRAAAGLTEVHLLRTIQQPDEVMLLFEARDIERAQAFAGSAELRQTMQRAGVIDRPDIHFLERSPGRLS